MTSVVSQIDWDAWRADYDNMTFTDQAAFYRAVSLAHPCQQSFDSYDAHTAFDVINGDQLNVHELGGWDGKLASFMLERPDVHGWVNWDIANVPQACVHTGYKRHVLTRPFWEWGPLDCDVFVATHTIEHLRARELRRVFDTVRCQWIYLQAPLAYEPTDWTGYPGSHILEVGWAGVNDMLDRRGYAHVHNGLWEKT